MNTSRNALHLASLVVLLCASVCWGSDAMLPAAPSADVSQARAAFWTHQARTEFAALGLAIAVDGVATQYCLAQNMHEADPIARPLVMHGAAGQAAASVIGFAAGVGISYALHRTGHPRAAVLARHIALLGETAAAAFTFVRSYHSQGGESWQLQH